MFMDDVVNYAEEEERLKRQKHQCRLSKLRRFREFCEAAFILSVIVLIAGCLMMLVAYNLRG